MNNSAFNNALDALVLGQSVSTKDDLTRFATDLYGKEHDMMMPAGLKSSIAANLGLDTGEESAAAAPVSRRSGRANRHEREYARRPWFMVATVAIAAALALTGILQWGMQTGDDGDDRFGILSPAVPTVEATPVVNAEATPSNEASWFVPLSPDECPVNEMVDRGKWIERQQELAANYEELARKDTPYGQPDTEDAEEVVIRNRQAVSCQALETNDALPIESARWARESQIESEVLQDEVFVDRLQRSRAFSDYVESDLQLTPTDLLHESASETGRIWDPSNAVQMADGRIALVTGWLAPADRELPTASSFASVWIEQDGQWLLDEELFFCIGDCVDYWAEREAALMPEATPSASPVIDAKCEIPESFEVDYEIIAAEPVNLWPGPGVDSGDVKLALPLGSTVMSLCESQRTSDPAIDDMEPGEHWLNVRTDDGEDGWIREIDMKPVASPGVPPTATPTG